jgi:hypothetical protein
MVVARNIPHTNRGMESKSDVLPISDIYVPTSVLT